jgi:hypothetical protein
MPVSSVPNGVEGPENDAANFEGGVAFWKTEGKVPLTSGQITDGPDTRWARGEFRNSDAPADFDPAAHTGKSQFGGHVGPAGETVTIDSAKISGKTAK